MRPTPEPALKWAVAPAGAFSSYRRPNAPAEEVDLIVPFHGRYDLVGELMRTLWATTRGVVYYLCLVDDGSGNADFIEQVRGRRWPSVVCVRHPERKGFGASLNSGLAATKSPWVVFLNSDVSFHDGGWLGAMGETYRATRGLGVKMVGARMDKATNGDPRVLGSKNDAAPDVVIADDPPGVVARDAYLPFVCVLAHRKLFEELGPVKEYPLGWYEDLEFACRMQSRGYRQAVSGAAHVNHVGGATVEAVCRADPRTRRVFESNHDRFLRDVSPKK